ncbi:MAG: transcriptional regulator [Thermodesulfobacteriota bacterium]
MKKEEYRDNVQTIRKQMIFLLNKAEMNARDLSRAMGIREKEVYEHLSHIARSVAAQGKKLSIRPFRCLECGYVFLDRQRFTRPGRCPGCKRSHIQEATYQVC